jgi:MiaB-like tRNA modifying enzyme
MARVYIEVYGCSANMADSEIALGILGEAGHIQAPSPDTADVNVVLTCIVKTPSERKMVKRLRELSVKDIPLVVAGCMPEAERRLVEEIVPGASLIGPNDLAKIKKAVEVAQNGGRIVAVGGDSFKRTCLPRVRRNWIVHIAPIASGCLGDCSYCIVKRARGHLYSYPADEIVDEVGRALKQGCREIWLTAEDTASYSWRGVRLPRLLEGLSSIDGRFFVRVGMMTPNQALPILNELIEAYGSEKVFKFLHVPVQSGDDDVLSRMRRRYSVDDFRRIVTEFRETFPSLSLSTDIICGFPGETEEQFNESLGLMEEVEPDVLNISRFWPRPGTDAAEMQGQLHGRETKRRSRKLTQLWRKISLERGQRWIGWKGEVLIDEHGRNGTVIGRNYTYRPVVLKTEARHGDFVKVRISGARVGYLLARTA